MFFIIVGFMIEPGNTLIPDISKAVSPEGRNSGVSWMFQAGLYADPIWISGGEYHV